MYTLKVFYEDTDAAGFVYYANYLKYIERARTQLLFNNNLNHTSLKEKFDIITIVKSCNIEYVNPAKLDDELNIFTSLLKKTRVQFYLNQKIYNKNDLIVEAIVRIVTINSCGKPKRMPYELYNIF